MKLASPLNQNQNEINLKNAFLTMQVNSSQEMVLQTLFCSNAESEALKAELWMIRESIKEYWFPRLFWLVD